MLIAPLTPADRDDAVALWRAAGVARPWNHPEADFDLALGGPTSAVLGGRADGALVATAMVGHDGHRGWVYYVAVAPELRGRGHGRAVMAAAEAWLAERDVPKLNLMVRADNAAARGFYATLGYGVDDVAVMSRPLT